LPSPIIHGNNNVTTNLVHPETTLFSLAPGNGATFTAPTPPRIRCFIMVAGNGTTIIAPALSGIDTFRLAGGISNAPTVSVPPTPSSLTGRSRIFSTAPGLFMNTAPQLAGRSGGATGSTVPPETTPLPLVVPLSVVCIASLAVLCGGAKMLSGDSKWN